MASWKFSALALVFTVCLVNASIELFNFNDASGTRSSLANWTELSDAGHDGESKATIQIFDNGSSRRAVFFSLLNPVGGRGYGSMRLIEQLEDLSDYLGFEINCRGQGEYTRFMITLRHHGLTTTSEPFYEAAFQAPTGEFASVTVPFRAFQELVGPTLTDPQTAMDTSDLTAFGIKAYIIKEGEDVFQTGSATLEINWIRAVKGVNNNNLYS